MRNPMASQSPTPNPADQRPSLALPTLRRARLHAELAGMDPIHAARAVTHAQRRGSGASGDQARFWRALYIELAPLGTAPATSDPIANALAGLPLEARTALLLRLGEAMPPADIATALGEPQARAAAHLAYAVSRLRSVLGQERSDPIWLGELQAWLHAHEPAAARIKRPAAGRQHAAPATPPAWTSATAVTPAQRQRQRQRLHRWLALALLLTLIGAAPLVAERWLAGPTAAALAAAVDPTEALLALPESDFALIGGRLDLDLLARLDFHLWRRDHEPPRDPSSDPLHANQTDNRAADKDALGSSSGQWPTLPASEQARRLRRLQEWQSLSPAQRAALRLNLPYWKALGGADRLALRQQRNAHLALPVVERERFEAEFDALSPVARRALLPPSTDPAHQTLARELFAFVPLDQQAATLTMLATLEETAQADLRRLIQRLPPWRREELRIELLAQPEASRSVWLSDRAAGRAASPRPPAVDPAGRQP